LDDSGAEKQPLDVIPLVEFDGEKRYFLRCETRAACLAGDAVYAVGAIIYAVVCQEEL
jgi:hypothetical protein